MADKLGPLRGAEGLFQADQVYSLVRLKEIFG